MANVSGAKHSIDNRARALEMETMKGPLRSPEIP